jgi:hypothetical protein
MNAPKHPEPPTKSDQAREPSGTTNADTVPEAFSINGQIHTVNTDGPKGTEDLGFQTFVGGEGI